MSRINYSRFLKGFIAQLKTPEYKQYFLSTHFWAPAVSFALPLGTLYQIFTTKAEDVNPLMTLALAGYSLCFMQFGLKVRPRNNLLVVCHLTNEVAQLVQGCRLLRHNQEMRRSLAEEMAIIVPVEPPVVKELRGEN